MPQKVTEQSSEQLERTKGTRTVKEERTESGKAANRSRPDDAARQMGSSQKKIDRKGE